MKHLIYVFLLVLVVGIVGLVACDGPERRTTWSGVPLGKPVSCSRGSRGGPWTCVSEHRAYTCVENIKRRHMYCALITNIPAPPAEAL